MDRIKLFTTGFTQVFLVVLNTYFITREFLFGILACGFLISFVWSHNVKKVAFTLGNLFIKEQFKIKKKWKQFLK